MVNNTQLPGSPNIGQELVTSTVTSGQSLNQVASNFATAINNDTNLKAINVTAIAYNNTVYITSGSGFSTTYTAYASSGATITAIIPNNISATSYRFNNVNEMVAIGGNLTTGNNVNLKGKTNTAIINANTTSSTININSPNSTDTTYTVSKSSAFSDCEFILTIELLELALTPMALSVLLPFIALAMPVAISVVVESVLVTV